MRHSAQCPRKCPNHFTLLRLTNRRSTERQWIYANRLIAQIGTRADIPPIPAQTASYGVVSAFLRILEHTHATVR